jgi:hypothetical protein
MKYSAQELESGTTALSTAWFEIPREGRMHNVVEEDKWSKV